MAIQILARLRDAFPVSIEMQQVLVDAPTVAHISGELRTKLPSDDTLEEMAEVLRELEAEDDLSGGDDHSSSAA